MSDSICYLSPKQINCPNDHGSHLAGFASGGELFTVRTALDPRLLVIENATRAARGQHELIAIQATDLPVLIAALLRVQQYMADCEREP